jgi:hypothetical protein
MAMNQLQLKIFLSLSVNKPAKKWQEKILLSIVTTEKMKNKEARKCVRETYQERSRKEKCESMLLEIYQSFNTRDLGVDIQTSFMAAEVSYCNGE